MIIGGKRERRLPPPCPAASGGGAIANARSNIINPLIENGILFYSINYLNKTRTLTRHLLSVTQKKTSGYREASND